MSEIDFAKLKAPFPEKQIDWRAARSGLRNREPWAQVLAYIDARAVQTRLDEVCGPANWRIEYQLAGKGFLAGLSIRIGNEWVTKWDGSDETDIEAFKGGLSRALVRAASAWGVGRYLYYFGTSYAQFTERSPGAQYIKIDGQEFYWVPPRIPMEFLTDEEKDLRRKEQNRAPKVSAPAQAQAPAPSPRQTVTAPASGSPTPTNGAKKVTEPQIKRLYAIMHKNNWDEMGVRDLVFQSYGLEHLHELNMQQYNEVCELVMRQGAAG